MGGGRPGGDRERLGGSGLRLGFGFRSHHGFRLGLGGHHGSGSSVATSEETVSWVGGAAGSPVSGAALPVATLRSAERRTSCPSVAAAAARARSPAEG